MASIIIGSAVLIGIAVKDRKEKKLQKAALLAGEDYPQIHGKPTVVSTRQLRKQQKHQKQEKVVVPDLPSYETVVSGRQEFANTHYGNEKVPSYEDSTRA